MHSKIWVFREDNNSASAGPDKVHFVTLTEVKISKLFKIQVCCASEFENTTAHVISPQYFIKLSCCKIIAPAGGPETSEEAE